MIASLSPEPAPAGAPRRGPCIAQIAWSCGFQSEASFSRAFRARFGQRPGDVRRGAGELVATSDRHEASVISHWLAGPSA